MEINSNCSLSFLNFAGLEILNVSNAAISHLNTLGITSAYEALILLSKIDDSYESNSWQSKNIDKKYAMKVLKKVNSSQHKDIFRKGMVKKLKLDRGYDNESFFIILENLLLEFTNLSNNHKHTNNDEELKEIFILKGRLRLRDTSFFTLEKLGTKYEVTRERIRQIQERLISDFIELISTNNHYAVHVSDEIRNKYAFLKNIIETNKFLSFKKLELLLIENGFKLSDSYSFVMSIFNFSVLNDDESEQDALWFNGDVYSTKKMAKTVISFFEGVLRAGSRFRLEILDVATEMKKKFKISTEEVRTIADTIENVEVDGSDFVLSYDFFNSISPKIYNVLSCTGIARHYKDIAREINSNNSSKKTVGFRTVHNALVKGDDFKRVGRNGFWGLKEWPSLRTVEIKNCMIEVLRRSGREMTLEEIESEVLKVRPNVKSNSISAYSYYDEFYKKNKKIGLLEWQKNFVSKLSNLERKKLFDDKLKSIFLKKEKLSSVELVSEFKDIGEFSKKYVEGQVYGNNKSLVRSKDSKGRVICEYKPVVELKPYSGKLENCRIEVEAFLRRNEGQLFRKKEIYEKIKKNINMSPASFYSAINGKLWKLPDGVEATREGRTSYLVFNQEEKTSVLYNCSLVNQIKSEFIKKEVINALSILNVNNMDSGEQKLGRVIESLVTRVYERVISLDANLKLEKKDLLNKIKLIHDLDIIKIGNLGYVLSSHKTRNHTSHELISDDQKFLHFMKAHKTVDDFLKGILILDNISEKTIKKRVVSYATKESA